MGTQMRPADGAMTVAEMKEFAGFSAATQRYIRRSLDVGLGRDDALARWSRDVVEAASIRAQTRIYNRLEHIRGHVPDDSGLDAVEPFFAPLVTVSAFDLGQDRLASFGAYRFLYERLIGANVEMRQRCRISTRRSGGCCCSRSAKPRRPRRAGRTASPASIRNGSTRSSSACRTDRQRQARQPAMPRSA
jgi:hypothetical protein